MKSPTEARVSVFFWTQFHRKMMQSTFSFPQAPKDSEGFITSFTLDQEEEYMAFFDHYGFVVVRDVITKVRSSFVSF